MTTPVSAERGRFNVVVFAAPGTGVRTLVQTCFGAMPAAEPLGAANLPGAAVFRDPDDVVELHIVRLGQTPNGALVPSPQREVLQALADHNATAAAQSPTERLHGAWFVQRWGAGDLSTAQMALLADIAEHLPVVLVVTQVPANLAGQRAREAVAYARRIDALMLPALGGRPVVLTNARAQETTGIPVHGVAELRTVTLSVAPEAAARARATATAASRRHRADRMRSALPTFLAARLPEQFGEEWGEQWDRVSQTSRSVWQAAWTRYRPR